MDQKRIGAFIAQCRREKNLTQMQLAELLDITNQAVSKWENGRGMPDVSLLQPLCDILEISLNELFSGEHISTEEYKGKAEENISKLFKEKQIASLKPVKYLFSMCANATFLIVAIEFMKKQQLSAEQKRLETDIWIIALVTLGVFLLYGATGKQLMNFVANSNISVIPRLLLNAGVQFGVAGLGITIVFIFRKENLKHFGFIRKNILK